MEAVFSTVASARARNLVRAICTLVVAVLLLTGQVASASPLASNAPTSADHIASDPLTGRFGSTRADFEATYGEPLGEASQQPPFGEPYAFSDYGGGTLYAYFNDDRLIYLTLVPEDGLKAMMGVLDILDTFLPSDYANGWIGDETSASFYINVQSSDLAAVVGEDVYEQYDAGIWVGDLHAFVLGTSDGDLTSVEFGLGWGEQYFDPDTAEEDENNDEAEADQENARLADAFDNAAAAEEDDSAGDSSAAEDEYVATLRSSFDEISDSIDDFYTLIEDPTLDLSDTATIFELGGIFAVWLDTYQQSLELTPPSGYEEIHEAYLGFTDALAQAAVSFTTDVETAVAELERAEEQAAILVDLLEDASRPDVFDVKSGYAKP